MTNNPNKGKTLFAVCLKKSLRFTINTNKQSYSIHSDRTPYMKGNMSPYM